MGVEGVPPSPPRPIEKAGLFNVVGELRVI